MPDGDQRGSVAMHDLRTIRGHTQYFRVAQARAHAPLGHEEIQADTTAVNDAIPITILRVTSVLTPRERGVSWSRLVGINFAVGGNCPPDGVAS